MFVIENLCSEYVSSDVQLESEKTRDFFNGVFSLKSDPPKNIKTPV